ncbi:MAG: serine hydrolase domain-containing protein [Thermoanaerobaculia bacterium]
MLRTNLVRSASVLWIALAAAALPAFAQAPKLDAATSAEVDRIAREVLAATGVPSASIAIVKDGQVIYLQAYGYARLEPRTPARPNMRYSIGSVSKQFTAAAILLLAEEGKLSLDDLVSRFLPDLTRARDVRIRDLLSHTSGYRDYWPQDYVPPFMRQPATAARILDRWAKQPLDFEPGTQYQYSNTGYVIAGLIVERAGGMPLLQLLGTRVFAPLGMTSVANIDQESLAETDPVGYQRFGLGPLRVAPKEGKGWLFAAGELAMTAQDLARWNISMIDRRLLKPASYLEMETAVRLKNGLGTAYGLGLGVAKEAGRRALTHGGEVSGFTASNMIFPDERAAVTVLVNQDASDAALSIAGKIAPLLFGSSAAAAEERARRIFEGLQEGKIDRSLFTDNANAYFTEQAVRDLAEGLAPLGKPAGVLQTRQSDRGGMTFRLLEVKFPGKTLEIWERDLPDGKIEQYQVMARD